MRVGIMTYYDSYNFGAVLQAYALQQALAALQLDSDIIAYKRNKYGALSTNRKAVSPLKFSQRVVRKYYKIRYESALPVRNQRYEDFRSAYLSCSEPQYTSEEEFRQDPPDYDAYICGSDQIWNPFHPTFSLLFLLDFVPQGKRRISYAPSFGVESIAGCPDYDDIVTALNQLDGLSVREKQGLRIVQEICGRQAAHVLDPTLLLDADHWSDLAQKNTAPRPYILLYALAEFSPKIRQFVEETRRREKCDVVVVPYNNHNFGNHYRKEFSAGPLEFLTLVKHAKGVITNSFHGTAFAILFGKPFWSFSGCNDEARQKASRMTDLLELLGLSSRFLEEGRPLPTVAEWPLDFTQAHQLLAQERQCSLKFLLDALSVRAINNKWDLS